MMAMVESRRVWRYPKDSTLNHPTANYCRRLRRRMLQLFWSHEPISPCSTPVMGGKWVQTFWGGCSLAMGVL